MMHINLPTNNCTNRPKGKILSFLCFSINIWIQVIFLHCVVRHHFRMKRMTFMYQLPRNIRKPIGSVLDLIFKISYYNLKNNILQETSQRSQQLHKITCSSSTVWHQIALMLGRGAWQHSDGWPSKLQFKQLCQCHLLTSVWYFGAKLIIHSNLKG